MIKLAYKVYCFGNLVFISCKKGNFVRGVGYGSTIVEALRNMTFYRES